MKRILYILCVALVSFPMHSLAAERYVAIGDSIAAGQTPNMAVDTGYIDLIAQQLAATGNLQSFDRSLPFPGLTVEEINASIQSDEAKATLQQATLITISAGANNLLPLIAHDATKGTIAYTQLSANFALNKVREGMEEMLEQLKKLAPNAKVYVMGYYFPYTSVHPTQLEGVTKELNTLNMILKNSAEQYGALFVEVEKTFQSNRIDYLPNPSDVHPNRLGYLAIANAFFSVYGLPQMTKQQLPPSIPKTFEEIIEQQRTKQMGEVAKTVTITQYVIAYGYARTMS